MSQPPLLLKCCSLFHARGMLICETANFAPLGSCVSKISILLVRLHFSDPSFASFFFLSLSAEEYTSAFSKAMAHLRVYTQYGQIPVEKRLKLAGFEYGIKNRSFVWNKKTLLTENSELKLQFASSFVWNLFESSRMFHRHFRYTYISYT